MAVGASSVGVAFTAKLYVSVVGTETMPSLTLTSTLAAPACVAVKVAAANALLIVAALPLN